MNIIITPVGGKVLIKIEKQADQTKSGIKLVKQGPEWNNETLLAEIVSKNEKDNEIEIGQIAVIRGDAGRWIDPELVEDREFTYRIIDKEEIIAIVNQQPASLEAV